MKHCRTDVSNAWRTATWVRIPYPFQWGVPTFHFRTSLIMVFVSLVASVDSVSRFRTINWHCLHQRIFHLSTLTNLDDIYICILNAYIFEGGARAVWYCVNNFLKFHISHLKQTSFRALCNILLSWPVSIREQDLVGFPSCQVKLQVLWRKYMFCCSAHFDTCTIHSIYLMAGADGLIMLQKYQVAINLRLRIFQCQGFCDSIHGLSIKSEWYEPTSLCPNTGTLLKGNFLLQADCILFRFSPASWGWGRWKGLHMDMAWG